ncbi:MAG: hypothetical protein FWE38_02100 [Firmicutes bacterium]|nr:hypothetical protein [Bacillota bacterium]
MRKWFLSFAIVALLAFMVGGGFLLPLTARTVNAISPDGHNVLVPDGRFDYVPPVVGDNAGRLTMGRDRGMDQDLVLTSEFFGTTGDARPIFSDVDMRRIVSEDPTLNWASGGRPAINDEGVFVHDFGMIMLDSSAGDANRVVVELTNLTGRNMAPTATWFEFTGRRSTGTGYATDANGNFIYDTTRFDYSTTPWMFQNFDNQSNDVMRAWTAQPANAGRIAINNQYSFAATFFDEGFYRFRFNITIASDVWGWVRTNIVVEFAFFIVHTRHYELLPILNTISETGVATPEAPIVQREGTDQFFFNFAGPNPFVRFDPRRFEVNVDTRNFQQIPVDPPQQMREDETDIYRITFERLGQYILRSRMILVFDGVEIPVLHFTGYTYTLEIFGFQAHFEEFFDNQPDWDTPNQSRPAWFGNAEVNADISGLDLLPTAANTVATTVAGARTFQTQMEQWASGARGGFRPVVTNSPPVQIFGTATFETEVNATPWPDGRPRIEFLNTVSFNDGRGWVQQPFVEGRPFDASGEYIVVLYYVFPVASGHERVVFRQIFNFRILNVMDVRVARTDAGGNILDVYTLNAFVDRRVTLSGSFLVFMDGATAYSELSPFMMRPRIELVITTFDGQHIRTIPSFDLENFATQLATQLDAEGRYFDGIYTFRVFYGALGQASAQFSVIVDNSKVNSFQLENVGGREFVVPNTHPDFAIWGGAGDINFEIGLRWGLKPSGVSFHRAQVFFHAFENRFTSFLQTDDHTAANLATPYTMMGTGAEPLQLRPVMIRDVNNTHIGYRLPITFRAAGLYIFHIMDMAGNTSIFTLVIDNSTQGFAQNPMVDDLNHMNMTTEATWVGFGQNKIIGSDVAMSAALDFHVRGLGTTLYTTETLYEILANAGMFGTAIVPRVNSIGTLFPREEWETRYGFAIPIDNVGISLEMAETSFQTVFDRNRPLGEHLALEGTDWDIEVPANVNRHYVHLNRENFYIFRTEDALGNISFYYVFVNFDMSRGTILEDDVPELVVDAASDEWSETASVVRPGGISNREFATFAFLQSEFIVGGMNNQFVVDTVDMAFHELNWQRFYYTEETVDDEVIRTRHVNPNYPFARDVTSTERLYQRPANTNLAEHWVYREINRADRNEGTLPGVYVITRRFNPVTVPADRLDEIERNYFFIVDNTPIIANPGVFDSAIEIDFGLKTADITNFQRINNTRMVPGHDVVLQTNSTASVRMPTFGTKFGHTAIVDGEEVAFGSSIMQLHFYTTNEFGARIPQTSFNFQSLRLNLVVQQRDIAGGDFTTLRDRNANNASIPFTDTGMYRLSFTDGSGGMRWQLYGFGERINEPNRSEILFEIERGGSPGAFYRGTNRVSLGSTQLQTGETLRFVYTQSDPNRFFADVTNSRITRGQLNTPNHPTITNVPSLTQTVDGGVVRVEYMLTNMGWAENDVFGVILYTDDPMVPPISHSIVIDNTPPQHNFRNIQALDRLWNERAGFTTNDLNEDRFIYAVPNNFIFSRPILNPDLEAFSISYVEVTPALTPMTGEIHFEYGGAPFAQRVGLQPGQSRFFRITERDEAGNTREYFIQLRGLGYIDRIGTAGVVDGDNLIADQVRVFGQGLRVNDVTEFWNQNPYFEIRYENRVFRRFNQTAQTGITLGGHHFIETPMVFNNARPADLVDVLNGWIGALGEGVMTLTINNRFHVWNVDVFQITNNTLMPMIAMAEGDNGSLTVSIVNWHLLHPMFRSFNFMTLGLFDMFDGTHVSQEFIPHTGEVIIPNGASRELRITVTDPFRRQVVAEHNGIWGNEFGFAFLGGTQPVVVQNRLLHHTGDERGVEISFTSNVHELRVYRNGQFINSAENMTFTPYENMMTVHFGLPSAFAQSHWRVVLVSRGTGHVIFDQEWVFYINLPEMIFSNLNGGDVSEDIAMGSVDGIVSVSFINPSTLFNVTITYARTFPNPNFDPTLDESETNRRLLTTTRTVRRGQTRFNLTNAGRYVITVMNDAWAVSTYEFTITDVDNTTYQVFFNTENPDFADWEPESESNPRYDRTQLIASPEPFILNIAVGNTFQQRRIPSYFIVVENNQEEWQDRLEIVPSLNYPRRVINMDDPQVELSGQDIIGNSVFTYIYILESDLTGSRMYLAVTPIWSSELSNVSINVESPNAFPAEGAGLPVPHYLLFNQLGAAGLIVTLQTPGGARHNQHPGNLYFADYSFNGRPVGRLFVGDELRLSAHDYGLITFRIMDWAGNHRIFTYVIPGTTDTDTVEHFTLINLTRPPILVNGESVIDGMVFNNEININVMEIPFTSNSLPGLHMYISQMHVTRNGMVIEDFRATSQHERRFWNFTDPGLYRFTVEYVYNLTPAGRLRIDFMVQLVNPTEHMESFFVPGAPNIEIVGVALNGSDARHLFPEGHLTQISLRAGVGRSGQYIVTMRVAQGNIRPPIYRSFTIMIMPMQQPVIQSNHPFGSTTTDVFIIRYNPYLIFQLFGDSELILTRDGEEFHRIVMHAGSPNILAGFPFIEVGSYQIRLEVASGATIFAESFVIREGLNMVAIMVIVGVVGFLIVGVGLFFTMRHRMRVK